MKSNLLKYSGILETTLDHSELHVITENLITYTNNIGGINVTKCLNEILQLSKTKLMKKSQNKYLLNWYQK